MYAIIKYSCKRETRSDPRRRRRLAVCYSCWRRRKANEYIVVVAFTRVYNSTEQLFFPFSLYTYYHLIYIQYILLYRARPCVHYNIIRMRVILLLLLLLLLLRLYARAREVVRRCGRWRAVTWYIPGYVCVRARVLHTFILLLSDARERPRCPWRRDKRK